MTRNIHTVVKLLTLVYTETKGLFRRRIFITCT